MSWLEFFKKDRFATGNGITLLKVEPGYAEAELQIESRHLNAGGVAQGGAIFTLADFVMAAAVNTHGNLAFSIQSDIRFLLSAYQGDTLLAKAEEILLRRTLAHYRVIIQNQKGETIAVFDGICHRKQSVENKI